MEIPHRHLPNLVHVTGPEITLGGRWIFRLTILDETSTNMHHYRSSLSLRRCLQIKGEAKG